MFKRLLIFVGVCCLLNLLFAFKPVYAVFYKLSAEQVKEAIEYGQKNKTIDMATFSKQWTVSLGKGKGYAAIFTPYHNVAYKAKKSAVERKEFTNKEVAEALEIGDALTFSVTVYGEEYDFAMYYSAKIYQKDEIIQPSFEFVPEIADASEFWPNSPANTARLVFKFPIKDIDLNAPVTLVIVPPGTDEIPFDFDLGKIK